MKFDQIMDEIVIKLSILNIEYIIHDIDEHKIEYSSGSKFWWRSEKLHRDEKSPQGAGSAVEYANGDKFYYLDDKLYLEKDYNSLIKQRQK